MTFDVCICTRNRSGDLARCIDSVLTSNSPVNKIIVSDDSTDEFTKIMVSSNFPDVIFLEGPRRGLGANRNHALSHVVSEFLIFLDDDAMLAKDFISNALLYMREHNADYRNTILTGVEINGGREVRSNDQNFLGFQSRVYTAGETMNTIVINSAVIPAEVAKTIKFDDALIYGGEEVDFALRARAAGIDIQFCANLRNLHFPSPRNRGDYGFIVNASRIYVTFKRYCMFEKNFAKAFLFLLCSSIHQIATDGKRSGLRGIVASLTTLRKAYGYIYNFLLQSNHAHIRSGS
jgi:glycosyltransferase involved in cell wall biosynthesis